MAKLEAELVKATGIEAKDGEKRTKFLARLVRAANGMEEKEWKALSTEAQEWVNAGIEKLNDKHDVDDFKDAKPAKEDKPAAGKNGKEKPAAKDDDKSDDDAEAGDEGGDDDDADAEDEEGGEAKDDDKSDDDADKPASGDKGGSKKGGSKKSDKPAAKKGGDKPAEKKGPSAMKRLRSMVIDHLDWDRAKVRKTLDDKGIPIGDQTLSIQFYEVHAIVNELLDKGMLSGELTKKLKKAAKDE